MADGSGGAFAKSWYRRCPRSARPISTQRKARLRASATNSLLEMAVEDSERAVALRRRLNLHLAPCRQPPPRPVLARPRSAKHGRMQTDTDVPAMLPKHAPVYLWQRPTLRDWFALDTRCGALPCARIKLCHARAAGCCTRPLAHSPRHARVREGCRGPARAPARHARRPGPRRGRRPRRRPRGHDPRHQEDPLQARGPAARACDDAGKAPRCRELGRVW
jgi:hypothetical protein